MAAIRSNLGLSDVPSEWTYDERLAYNNALATYINANPGVFSASDLAIANNELNQNNVSLSDTSFTSGLSDFFGNLEDEAVSALDDIGGVGRGVLSTFRLASWVLPLAAVAVVIILLFAFRKKVSA